jgi:capsular exopolysaccharide synthesis family protein
VVICAILGGASAYAVAKRQAPVYRATTLLVVDQNSQKGDPYTNLLASNQAVQTYLNLIKTPPVVDQAAQQVGGVSGSTLLANLHVSNPGISTQILEIQVDNTSPHRAAALANAVASSFISVQSSQVGGATVHVFETAVPPTTPDHPSPKLYAGIGALAGILLAVGLVLLMELLDDRVRSAADVEQTTGLPLLATVPNQPRSKLLLTADGHSILAERFRSLRTSLGFAASERPPSTILVTSAMPGEGKTMVAINLAISLAMTKKRVLLIDADLRHPSVQDRLKLPQEPGLSGRLLQAEGGLPVTLPPAGVEGVPTLSVITAGALPSNPTELLGSKAMQRLLGAMLPSATRSGLADIVVIDTPPVAGIADAAVLAETLATGPLETALSTVLVVNAKRCRQHELLRAHEALGRVRTHIAGFVLNQATRATEESYAADHYALRQVPTAAPPEIVRFDTQAGSRRESG